MNPKYRFFLTIDSGSPIAVKPIYKEDLSIEWSKETGQHFFRRKLSGKLTFTGKDYDLIMPTPSAFGSKFILDMEISYDNGATYSSYWQGVFYHTDCEINIDDKTVIVTPEVNDDYTSVIAGMEKEYNLIDLAPAVYQIKLKKRPIVQVYLSGQSKISCFMGGMYWEQDCEATTNYNTLTQNYKFAYLFSAGYIDVTQQGSPTIPSRFVGNIASAAETSLERGDYKIHSEGVGYVYITRLSDNKMLWYADNVYLDNGAEITLTPNTEQGASGNVKIKVHSIAVYMRALTDVLSVDGVPTYEISSSDLVADNRNYNRVAVLNVPSLIWYTDVTDDEPTKWGKAPNGEYYTPAIPGSAGVDVVPMARSQWDVLSFWYIYTGMSELMENKMTTEIVLRDAYMLSDCIALLLSQFSNVTFGVTTAYSQFLNSTDPITNDVRKFFITPKSNVVTIDYDEAATKAPITLKTILDMLQNCFKCYWFIDNGKLRIEHIKYFNHGGSYTATQQVGIDLTTQTCIRNGKELGFGLNKVTFDKPELTSRYEFGWMDDVTKPFMGEPITINASWVNQDKIEKIEVSQFTSDIDYILMNPADISPDGFVLMGAKQQSGQFYLPTKKFASMDNVILQNPYCAFVYLQQYYAYDMPALYYTIGEDNSQTAVEIQRIKNQSVDFPCLTDPDVNKLVKTFIGNGQIEKLNINLSSRNGKATLKFAAQ